MPGLSGLDLLRAIKGTQPATPVVLITGVPSVNSAVFGLRHGAYDYLPKPFSVTEVRELIHRLRRDRAEGNGNVTYPAGLNEELQRRQGGVEVLSSIGELALQGLEPARFVEKVLEKTLQNLRCDAAIMVLSDQEGKFNASRMGQPAMVGELLTLLHAHFADVVKAGGRETYALTNKEHGFEALAALIPGVGDAVGILCMVRAARTGAFLPDDLGKLVMLDNILRKPRQLPEEEFEIVRSHPVVGDKILKPLRFLSCEAKAVRHHHERYDGKGYPDGIQGEAIPLIARVVTVADAFDAMTSDRPYRAKRPIAAAIDEISRGARTQFDPVIAV